MKKNKERYEKFKLLNMVCPVCDSCNVRTRLGRGVRICLKCGEEWKK